MSQQLTFDLAVDSKGAVDSINAFFDAFDKGANKAKETLKTQLGESIKKEISVELKNGKLVAKEIDSIEKTSSKLGKAVKVINGEFGKTPAQVRESISILKELISKTAKYEGDTRKVSQEWKDLVILLKAARKEGKDLEINDKFERSITGANIAAGLALDAIRGMGRAVADLVKQGIGMEVLMIQLKGFTGSAQEATKAFDEYVRIAQSTPFNVKQVAEASKIMMGFGISTEESTHRVEQLAIVASATGGDLGFMARNLGQIQANQRAYTRDLMQFANNGIPIYQMLADVLGQTTGQIRKMAEDGTIGFSEVNAALDLMTQKTSAYYKIAQDMDKTIQARLEALASSITILSGKFINTFQQMDEAMGGPFEKSILFLINAFKELGKLFDRIGRNAKTIVPIITSLGFAFAALITVALVQNLTAVATMLGGLIAKLVATKAAVYAAASAVALFNAMITGIGPILLAAGIGAFAGGMLILANNTRKATESTESFLKRLREENKEINGQTDAMKLLAFQTEGLTQKQALLVAGQKDTFKDAQKKYNMEMAGAERALKFLEMKTEEEKAIIQASITGIKEKISAEKDGLDAVLEKRKQTHDTEMANLNKELAAVREQYDLKLGALNEESQYAKRLNEIKRAEINEKLRSTDLSEKERLELQEQLLQMDRAVERRKLLAQQKIDEKQIQDKINTAQEKYKQDTDAINKSYKDRIAKLEATLKAEEKGMDEINKKIEARRKLVKDARAEELKAIFENEEAAVASLNRQIGLANDFRDKMLEAYRAAKKANEEAAKTPFSDPTAGRGEGRAAFQSGRASGGPVVGGTSYTVNELGKEAFLSAAGRLSMINAPAFGTWKAPGAGTVIPAHLTKQLDVPAGGINLNSSAGSAALRGNNMNGLVNAIRGAISAGGDTFHQNVTVQATNPVQAANNLMVQMTGLKRRRLG